MLIGELVKRTGMSKDAIRFYEKRGLIKLTCKERRENNYKEYSEEIFEKLKTILRLKDFGFTLNEVSEMLDLIEVNEATCDNVSGKISAKIELLDRKIEELIKVRTMLLTGAQKCAGYGNPDKAGDNCPIIVPQNARGIKMANT